MKSRKLQATIGINPGYFHNNEKHVDFEHLLYDVSDLVYNETNTYISWNVFKIKTIYKMEWGCPDGGEVTYSIETTANPEFHSDLDKWAETATMIVKKLMDALDQTTVTVTVHDVEITYLKRD